MAGSWSSEGEAVVVVADTRQVRIVLLLLVGVWPDDDWPLISNLPTLPVGRGWVVGGGGKRVVAGAELVNDGLN